MKCGEQKFRDTITSIGSWAMYVVNVKRCSFLLHLFLLQSSFQKQEFLKCLFHRSYYTYKKQTHSPLFLCDIMPEITLKDSIESLATAVQKM